MCGRWSLSSLFLPARLTLALLYHQHSLLPDLGPTAQGHGHRVGFGWGAAGAGGPVVEGPCPSTQLCKLTHRWDKQGAALTKTQLVVHCYCVASVCCHMLGGWQKRGEIRLNITAILSVSVYLWGWKINILCLCNSTASQLIFHQSHNHLYEWTGRSLVAIETVHNIANLNALVHALHRHLFGRERK